MKVASISKLSKPHGSRQWSVQYKVGKKRRQNYFRTEREALSFVRELERNLSKLGRASRNLTADEVSDYIEAKKLVGGGLLVSAINSLMSRRFLPANASNEQISVAVCKFLGEKESANRSKRHLNHLRSVLTAFSDKFVSWDAVSDASFNEWLLKRGSPRTIKNVYSDVSNFCTLSVRRGWIASNPIANIRADDLPRVVKKQIGILTPAELRTFLAHVEAVAPKYLPYFLVQAYAGIRNAEAQLLSWDMINTKAQTITLDAAIVKTRDAWTMRELPPVLWHELGRCKHGKKWVVPSYWAECKLHHCITWRDNCLRHSFATYHLSLYGDSTRTSLLLRHTNPRQLYQSYLSTLVPKEVAADYFAITV